MDRKKVPDVEKISLTRPEWYTLLKKLQSNRMNGQAESEMDNRKIPLTTLAHETLYEPSIRCQSSASLQGITQKVRKSWYTPLASLATYRKAEWCNVFLGFWYHRRCLCIAVVFLLDGKVTSKLMNLAFYSCHEDWNSNFILPAGKHKLICYPIPNIKKGKRQLYEYNPTCLQ